MEIRFSFDDEVIGEIRNRSDIQKASDISREAIDLFDWATEQVVLGRTIVSVDESGLHPNPAFNQGLRRTARRGE